jgi:hypothetical protein
MKQGLEKSLNIDIVLKANPKYQYRTLKVLSHQGLIDVGIGKKYNSILFDETHPPYHFKMTFFKNIDPLILKAKNDLRSGNFRT